MDEKPDENRQRYVVMALESGAPIGDALIVGPHRSFVTAQQVANRFNDRHPEWSAIVVHLHNERSARAEASRIDGLICTNQGGE